MLPEVFTLFNLYILEFYNDKSFFSIPAFLPRVFPEAVVNDISGENKAGAADVSASQHVMVCALKELGSLVQSLSATASPLIQEPSIGKGKDIQTQLSVYPGSSSHNFHLIVVVICVRHYQKLPQKKKT